MALTAGQAALAEAIAAKSISANRSLYILPLYLCSWFDSLLMGVVISQCFTYWKYVTTDKKHIVGLVCPLLEFKYLCVELRALLAVYRVQVAASLHVVGDSFHLHRPGKPSRPRDACTADKETFYIDRACRIYQHWWPAALTAPFAIAGVATGAALLHTIPSIFPFSTPDMLEHPVIKPLAYSWLSVVLFADLLITSIITYGLSKIKTGWVDTDSKLRRATIRCFESQTPALISSILMLIAWNRAFTVALACGVLQSKIYTIGLLITLTDRAGPIKSQVNTFHSSSINQQAFHYPSINRTTDEAEPKTSVNNKADDDSSTHAESHQDMEMDRMKINVETDVVQHYDYGSTTGLNEVGVNRAMA